MTQPAKVQEPSMEEILASIRRIIADDEKPAEGAAAADVVPAKSAAKPAAAPVDNNQDDIDALLAGFDSEPAASALSEPDILELTDEMALPEHDEAAFRTIEPSDDVEFAETAEAGHAASRALGSRAASFRAEARSYVTGSDAPLSPPPRAAESAPVTPPLNILSRSTVSAVESAFNSLATTVLSNNARTLEDLVKEMLRPMLKTWLDDNLPEVVERIVRAEIERVSRGR